MGRCMLLSVQKMFKKVCKKCAKKCLKSVQKMCENFGFKDWAKQSTNLKNVIVDPPTRVPYLISL